MRTRCVDCRQEIVADPNIEISFQADRATEIDAGALGSSSVGAYKYQALLCQY
jgi:hypothetical protein